MPYLRMESGESFAEFLHVARGRARFSSEAGLRLAGDEIDLTAVGDDVEDHDMAVGYPPVGTIVDRIPFNSAAGNTVR